MPKIKVGVIGVGHLGSRHARIYRKSSQCILTGICDIEKKRLEPLCAELGVTGYTDYHQLFGKVEAVSIAVPTIQHYPIARDSLKNKIHTLVEKPFTTNLKEADRLIKLAKEKKLILQVGHIERFNSAYLAAQKVVKNPRFIECHRLSPFPHRSLDIGVVLDLMIHDLDIILGLVNSAVKKIEATGVRVLSRDEDIANARLNFKNGCVANLTASRISDEVMRKIRIFLKEAYISLDYKNEHAFLYRRGPCGIIKESLPIEREEPLQKELESFIQCCLRHKEPLVSGRIAREALKVALAIRKKIWQKNIS